MTWGLSLDDIEVPPGPASNHPVLLVPARTVLDDPLPLEVACSYAASIAATVLIGQIEVIPPSLPLDAERAVFREERTRVYEAVERVSASYRCSVEFASLPARGWAQGIARLARGRYVTGIYVALRRSRWVPGWWLPRDLRTLLACAPCPVHLIHASRVQAGREPVKQPRNPDVSSADRGYIPPFDPGERYG